MKELLVEVGIVSGAELRFVLGVTFHCGNSMCTGEQLAVYSDGKIRWNGESYEELLFSPVVEDEAFFELTDVTIGVNFHWERKERQRFAGKLKLVVDEGKLVAVNIVPVETYLTSVISSEMSATASLELLKAHAVISRSWLLNIIKGNKKRNKAFLKPGAPLIGKDFPDERIVWYDHQAHTRYDVCADDHCQRYQGMSKVTNPNVRRAIDATYGEVLTYEGRICDARFSKCCGGATEEFRYCWEDIDIPYLKAFTDIETGMGLPDLTDETEAQKWICTSPNAFCNTCDKGILSQILNNYDRETPDFYRWKVEYTASELSELIFHRSEIDFGKVMGIQPVERGKSGRLVKLRIVGTKRSMIIGKELEIRRILSSSHLYSSAFVVDKIDDRFIFTGAGWGHGVGLCQIGAAVMGEKGYKYDEILLHYYKGATIEKKYGK